jgi:hypothetical protein
MAESELENMPQPLSVESSWSSATKLSRKVRELAHRSFLAIHSGRQQVDKNYERSKDILDDLRELNEQIAWLQHKIHARKLDSLIPWVDALKRQVDDRLGDVRKGKQ